MLFCEGLVARHVDSDVELDVLRLFLKDLEVCIRG